MRYFNFRRLIKKYETEFTLVTQSEGKYEYGEWVESEENQIVMRGAIISHKESKIFRAEGTLKAKDKRLFMTEPLEKALEGAKVIYNGNVYSVEDCTDNAIFTGVYAYTLKYVSAFDKGANK